MKLPAPHFPVTSFLYALLVVSLFLLGGCSSIKVVESWKNPSFAGPRYHKLMIIGVGHDEGLRSMAENIIVDELRRGGVTAVASHTLVKEIDTAKREEIVAAVHQAGVDAVLGIRVASRGDTKITQDGQSGGIYGTTTNVGGALLPGATSYSLATLRTSLFDSSTEALVWSATIKTYDAGDVARVSRDLAHYFLENMRKEGLF